MKPEYPAILFAILASSAICPAADPPDWWTEYGVIGGTPNNKGPANLGQLKWMAWTAWWAMESKVPGGPGFAISTVIPDKPASPDAAWYENQKLVANLGQLKHVASPFYDRLNLLAPDWVAEEFERNGLALWNHSVPWDPATPVGENLSPATIGQLKLVFSLRFGESHDGDAIPDLSEYIFYGSSSGDGTTTDYDGDGLKDAEEIAEGTRIDDPDSDGDGLNDLEDPDPVVPESSSQTASGLIVWTTLEE